MPSGTYAVYNFDAAKRINTIAKTHKIKGKPAFEHGGGWDFQIDLDFEVQAKVDILKDRLLETKIHKKTDPQREKMFKTIDGIVDGFAAKGRQDKASLSKVQADIQKALEDGGKEIQNTAHVILSKYLNALNVAKVTKKKLKVKSTKSVIAVGVSAVSLGGAIAVTAASGGAGAATIAVSAGLLIKSCAKMARLSEEIRKDLSTTKASMDKTLLVITTDFNRWAKENKNHTAMTTGREALAKTCRELLATNTRSIKKLEQDLGLLKTKAELAVGQAAEMGRAADDAFNIRENAQKELNQLLADLKQIDAVLKATSDKAEQKVFSEIKKAYAKNILDMNKEVAKMRGAANGLVKAAAEKRKQARNVLKEDIGKYQRWIDYYKGYRYDTPLKFLTFALKLSDAAANLAAGSGDIKAIGSLIDNAAQATEAVKVTGAQLVSISSVAANVVQDGSDYIREVVKANKS